MTFHSLIEKFMEQTEQQNRDPREQPTITRKKLPNPVNPTKKTTGNIGVGSFSAHVDLMQLLRHIMLSSLKNHHLSSCVFFFQGSLPQSEAAARSMRSKPRNTSAQKFEKKRWVNKKTKYLDPTSCHLDLCQLIMVFSDFLVGLSF